MYLTILHGHVKKENWHTLEESFERKAKHPPEGLQQSFLTHCEEDTMEWKIISVWRSEETYKAARSAGHADTCVEFFCDAGTTPERRHYSVVERFMRVADE
jgi:heme-degrading monooxygenase HmoA